MSRSFGARSAPSRAQRSASFEELGRRQREQHAAITAAVDACDLGAMQEAIDVANADQPWYDHVSLAMHRAISRNQVRVLDSMLEQYEEYFKSGWSYVDSEAIAKCDVAAYRWVIAHCNTAGDERGPSSQKHAVRVGTLAGDTAAVRAAIGAAPSSELVAFAVTCATEHNWISMLEFIAERHAAALARAQLTLPIVECAAQEGQLDVLQWLVWHCQFDRPPNVCGERLLAAARRGGHPAIARWVAAHFGEAARERPRRRRSA